MYYCPEVCTFVDTNSITMLPFLIHTLLLCLSLTTWALLTAISLLMLRYCRRRPERLITGILVTVFWLVTSFNAWYEGMVLLQQISLLCTFNSWAFVVVTPLFYLYYRLRLTGIAPRRQEWFVHLLLPGLLLLYYVAMTLISPLSDRMVYSWHELLPNLSTWWGLFRLSCYAGLVGQLCVYLPRLFGRSSSCPKLRREMCFIFLLGLVALLCLSTPFPLFHLLYLLCVGGVSIYLFMTTPIFRLLRRWGYRYMMSDFLHSMEEAEKALQKVSQMIAQNASPVASQKSHSPRQPFTPPATAPGFFTLKEEARVEVMVHMHLHNPQLSIRLLARELGTNETYLSRYFNHQRKISFPEYVNTCRLDEAEKLLKRTDATVAEIAEQVGFRTLSSFYLAFNARHQMPPAQWRKRR